MVACKYERSELMQYSGSKKICFLSAWTTRSFKPNKLEGILCILCVGLNSHGRIKWQLVERLDISRQGATSL